MSVALTAEGFDRLLALLSADRNTAGERYEIVRLKLVKYFELRMCAAPAELADETIDRVARRLAEGQRIQADEPLRYIYGVARNVFHEHRKSERRHEEISDNQPAADESRMDLERSAAALRVGCLQTCLDEQPAESRALLWRYYEHTGRAKIEQHAALARQMAIPVNALRIRIHRIKAVVQHCIEKCVKDRAG